MSEELKQNGHLGEDPKPEHGNDGKGHKDNGNHDNPPMRHMKDTTSHGVVCYGKYSN